MCVMFVWIHFLVWKHGVWEALVALQHRPSGDVLALCAKRAGCACALEFCSVLFWPGVT